MQKILMKIAWEQKNWIYINNKLKKDNHCDYLFFNDHKYKQRKDDLPISEAAGGDGHDTKSENEKELDQSDENKKIEEQLKALGYI